MRAHARYILNGPSRQRGPLTAPRARRRLRYVDKLETAPDRRERWALFIERLGIEFDDDLIDRLLDEAVSADVGAIQLHEFIRGAP
jgi:hypothetical protein